MISLDKHEAEIVLIALKRCDQMDGKGGYAQVTGAAWFCTQLCRSKMNALIARLEGKE